MGRSISSPMRKLVKSSSDTNQRPSSRHIIWPRVLGASCPGSRARLVGRRVRSAEVAVEMMNGRPPPGRAFRVQYVDVQERWNVDTARYHARIAEASTRFVPRGGQ